MTHTEMIMNSGLLVTATDRIDRWSQAARRALPATLRVVAGLLWLSNVSWKLPTSFGESADGCRGLCGFVQAGIDHPVAPVYPWVLETIIQPNLQLFGWMVLAVETILAALLLSGTWVRVAAVVGMAQSIAIGLSVANADGEWYWSYALMVVLHFAVFATAVERRSPVDARRRVAVGGLIAGYGLVVLVANIHNIAGSAYTRDWLIFGSRTGFPGDFGRNVFPGSVLLGLLLVALGAVAWLTAGQPSARISGAVAVALAVVLIIVYRDSGNLLAAKASSAAVLLAVGLYLLTPPVPVAARPDPPKRATA